MKYTKVRNLAVSVCTRTFNIPQGVVKLLVDHVMQLQRVVKDDYWWVYDDSAFLFTQREKKLCRLLGTLHSNWQKVQYFPTS